MPYKKKYAIKNRSIDIIQGPSRYKITNKILCDRKGKIKLYLKLFITF